MKPEIYNKYTEINIPKDKRLNLKTDFFILWNW